MKVIIVSILLLPSLLFASPLYLSADWSSFNPSKDSLVYVELYYSFNRAGLDFEKDTTGQVVGYFDLHFWLYDSTKQTVLDSFTQQMGAKIQSQEEASQTYLLYDFLGLLLKPGYYNYRLVIKPSKSKGEYVDGKISLKAYPEEGISLSDITLISHVEKDTTTGPFHRYGRKIIPSTSGFFGGGDQTLYFYVEAYGVPKEDTTNFYLAIADTSGKALKSFKLEDPIQQENKRVFIKGISIAGLSEGTYILQVVYNQQDKVVGKGKIFRVQRPRQQPQYVDISNLEAERRKLIYFASPAQLNQYDELSDEGKVEFIKAFWGELAGKNLSGKQFKQIIDQRWDYASQRFATSQNAQDGWKTDRGRIYILYGPPDDVERHSLSAETNAWQKWLYNDLNSGTFFIFADIYGIGEYRLVHSNMDGEPNNPNWKEKLNR